MGPASRKNHVFVTIHRAKSRASLPPFPLTDQCVPSTRSYLNKKWMSIERVMGATFSGVYSQAVADSAAGPNVLLRPSSTHRFWISRLFSFSLSQGIFSHFQRKLTICSCFSLFLSSVIGNRERVCVIQLDGIFGISICVFLFVSSVCVPLFK